MVGSVHIAHGEINGAEIALAQQEAVEREGAQRDPGSYNIARGPDPEGYGRLCAGVIKASEAPTTQ